MQGPREDRPMSGSSQLSNYSEPDPYLRSTAQDIRVWQVLLLKHNFKYQLVLE